MSIARRAISPEALVGKFNRQFPIGTRVRYWTGLVGPPSTGKVVTTRTEASVLGGHTAVVWLEGVSGCVALSHLEPLPEGGAA